MPPKYLKMFSKLQREVVRQAVPIFLQGTQLGWGALTNRYRPRKLLVLSFKLKAKA